MFLCSSHIAIFEIVDDLRGLAKIANNEIRLRSMAREFVTNIAFAGAYKNCSGACGRACENVRNAIPYGIGTRDIYVAITRRHE